MCIFASGGTLAAHQWRWRVGQNLLKAAVGSSFLNQVISHGVTNQFAKRFQIQLLHNRCPVSFRCLHTDAQFGCDLLVAIAFREHLHDFPFSRIEPIRRALIFIEAAPQVLFENEFRDA